MKIIENIIYKKEVKKWDTIHKSMWAMVHKYQAEGNYEMMTQYLELERISFNNKMDNLYKLIGEERP